MRKPRIAAPKKFAAMAQVVITIPVWKWNDGSLTTTKHIERDLGQYITESVKGAIWEYLNQPKDPKIKVAVQVKAKEV